MDNLREIEYSQIVRTKLMNLRVELAAEYGEKFSRKALGKITKAVRSLEVYCDMGTKITYYNEFMKDLNNPEGYIERRQRDFLRRYEEHKKELLYKQQMQKMPSIMASFNLCALRRTFQLLKAHKMLLQ